MTVSKSNVKKTFLICFFIFLVAILVCGCSFGSSKDSDTEQNEEPMKFYYMNENLIDDDICYKVYEATIQKAIPTTLGTEITTNNFFVYIKINITNYSHESKYLYLSDFQLFSPSGNQYEATDYIFIYNRMNSEKLGAGFSNDFYMVFEIPYIESDGDYKLAINESFWFWEDDPYIILNDLQSV